MGAGGSDTIAAERTSLLGVFNLGGTLGGALGGFLPAVGVEVVLGELAGEVARQADVDGLVLVVLVASFGTAVHALTTVEKVGGTVPDIAESVDVQRLLEVTLADS